MTVKTTLLISTLCALLNQSGVKIEYPSNYKTLNSEQFVIGDFVVLEAEYIMYPWPGMPFEPEKWVLDAASFLQTNSDFDVEVHCHTDSRGSTDSNSNLSERRAKSLRDELVSRCNVDSSRIVRIVGFGESELLVLDEEIAQLESDSEKERAHQLNRRLGFLLVERKKK